MEIELKLALQPGQSKKIRRHPWLHHIKPTLRTLHSIYFDTPGFDLMHRHIALRLRKVGKQWIQTLKAETQSVGVLTSRPEWEIELQSGSHPEFSVLPDAAGKLLAGIKLKHIQPVFITEFERTTWFIERDGHAAELALDRGIVRAGEQCQDICEVEIELQSGHAEFLFDVALQLLQHVPLHVEPRSKAERGYILCGAIHPTPAKANYPVIRKDQSPTEVCQTLIRSALIQMTANMPGFQDNADDTEYLHQLRIALRRLQTAVMLAKSLKQPTPAWYPSLRTCMRSLNPARDWDVFLYQTLPGIDNVDAAGLQRIRHAATAARRQAQTMLNQPAMTEMILDIGRGLMASPNSPPSSPDARAWSQALLEQRWQSLHKRCRHFFSLNAEDRHIARIAAKKMRYLSEAFAPLHGKPAHDFIAALSALQDDLGKENDHHIGIQLLRTVPKQSATLGFELGRMSGILEAETTRHHKQSSQGWQQLSDTKKFWR